MKILSYAAFKHIQCVGEGDKTFHQLAILSNHFEDER
jgi:hypothetical protein